MQPTNAVAKAATHFGWSPPALRGAESTMCDHSSEFEFISLKRARRLLRICDIAVTKADGDRMEYLERACCDDPDLLKEAIDLLAAVDDSQNFLMDFERFRSLPPRSG